MFVFFAPGREAVDCYRALATQSLPTFCGRPTRCIILITKIKQNVFSLAGIGDSGNICIANPIVVEVSAIIFLVAVVCPLLELFILELRCQLELLA